MPSPTTDPYRLLLMKGLCAALANIRVENGYYTNAGAAVFRGRLTFGADDPLPCVAILEPPMQPEPRVQPLGARVRQEQMDVYVQGFAVDDKKNPSDPAQLLLADIKKAIALEWRKGQKMNGQSPSAILFGVPRNTLIALDTDGGLARPSDDISSKAYCYLLLRFTLAEVWVNPDE